MISGIHSALSMVYSVNWLHWISVNPVLKSLECLHDTLGQPRSCSMLQYYAFFFLSIIFDAPIFNDRPGLFILKKLPQTGLVLAGTLSPGQWTEITAMSHYY